MNEMRRMAYLNAMGIDSYVSRRQLPGAAATRRVAIPSRFREPAVAPAGHERAATGVIERPSIVLPKPGARVRTERTPDPPPADKPHTSVPRFSLVSIVAGDWLWLEDLAGMPLTTEQVQLVQAMARALQVERRLRDTGLSTAAPDASRPDIALPDTARPDTARPDTARPDAARPDAARPDRARPDVMQFDWPIHANRQLDQGEEAARAGVAGFLARRLEQNRSCGLVLLGQTGAARVAIGELNVLTVCTASSADILASPALKQQVWRDLLPLIRSR